MQVEGSVDGNPCRLTVDTGAEKTLVRPDMLAATRVSDAPQRLCGVTRHCVQLKGPVDVRIGVGSAVERLPVYVADLDEPCLLGLDYLTQSKACVDLGRKLVRMVANLSDEARKVPAGAKLGTCEEVERPEETSGRAEVAAVRPLPDFLEDLAHRSAGNLTEAQTEKVLASAAEGDDKWRKAQREDSDLAPIIQWLEAGGGRPRWEAVAPESPASKCLVDHRELRLPVDLATGQPPDMSLPTVTSGYAAALQEHLEEVHRRDRGKLKVAGQAMKETYDHSMRNRYHGPGRYSWGHGGEDEDVSPSSSDEDVAGAAGDGNERGAGSAASDSGDLDPELGG
ncbi:hypothetical protein O3P69_002622 [Scylla paramamosain]|uniref:Peptidase A2 domain-containing protein n=1 Tax=Scylla paramamosain TaxID=85552 RepID=A0AAW0UNY5_SCYPA